VAQGQSSGPINIAAVQDVSIDTSGASAELATGGLRINITPRDGGNRYSVSMFASTARGGMSDGNLTARLRARGLTTINTIKSVWDLNPGGGGPLTRDRVWFYGSFRYQGADNYAAARSTTATRRSARTTREAGCSIPTLTAASAIAPR
jgi:hypothetical protein